MHVAVNVQTDGQKWGGIQRDGTTMTWEVGKWRSLSRKVEGATWSLALAVQWFQLPLGPPGGSLGAGTRLAEFNNHPK